VVGKVKASQRLLQLVIECSCMHTRSDRAHSSRRRVKEFALQRRPGACPPFSSRPQAIPNLAPSGGNEGATASTRGPRVQRLAPPLGGGLAPPEAQGGVGAPPLLDVREGEG
jgi:hypothetical protein